MVSVVFFIKKNYLEIYQNNIFFIIKKNIFDISTSKQYKKLNLSKKIKNLWNAVQTEP